MVTWKVDPKDAVPVYEQLGNLVRHAVACGRFVPGDRLPSVRELARDALVNPNTIVRVFRDLEHEGVVRTEGGRGVFVTDEAPKICRRASRAIVHDRIEQAILEAEKAGLPKEEIEAAIEEALAARRARSRR